jgi:AAA15 family ATPase/GTPase
MLVQVTLENVLSFRDEVTFSMLGVSSDRSHENHLFVDVAGKGRSVLPIAAIYGANASGKSNFIEAITFAQDMIVKGTREGQKIPVSSFKLGDYYSKPSKFEFIFIEQGNLYNYGFKLNTVSVFEEWLYVTPQGKTKELMIFERFTDENGQTKVDYGSILKGRSQKQIFFMKFVIQGTQDNQLFLTELFQRNVKSISSIVKKAISPVMDWFRYILTIISAESRFRGLENKILENHEFTQFISDVLQNSGTGIHAIRSEKIKCDLDTILKDVPENMRQEVIDDIEKLDDDSIMVLDTPHRKYFLEKGNFKQIYAIEIKTIHKHENGENIDFLLEEESEGTQRLIHLIPALYMIKDDSSKVILLDELDRRLHPLLSRQFIEIAFKCRKQDNYNQLIFTTHDTNLLDLEVFRKDEIWFVEKNEQGASEMYSLAEFKIDPNIQLEKGYLNGRFGAIPFLGDIKSLGWLDCESNVNQEAKVAQ